MGVWLRTQIEKQTRIGEDAGARSRALVGVLGKTPRIFDGISRCRLDGGSLEMLAWRSTRRCRSAPFCPRRAPLGPAWPMLAGSMQMDTAMSSRWRGTCDCAPFCSAKGGGM